MLALNCRALSRASRIIPSAAGKYAQRSATSLSGAEGNLVKFLGSDGQKHWGKIVRTEENADPIIDSILGAPIGDADHILGQATLVDLVLDDSSAYGSMYEEIGRDPIDVLRVLPPLPVVPAPAIIFMGLNYKKHAEETNQALPRFPIFAFKNPGSTIGSGAPISIPSIARQKPEVDYEAELAIIIGRHIRDASADEALNAILGVTAANDVSARRWQGKKGGGQWSRSKSFDTFCPLGPSVLPIENAARSLKEGGRGLRLRSWLDDEVMQDGNTSDMIFGIADIVSYISQGTTLLPGTVILTGTPPGVGYVRDPPVYLQEGDVVKIELEGCGTLSNPVINGP